MPELIVLCTVFNHEKYLKDALEGFVMQKTNFKFEVIVHDDASSDRSSDIIREYAEKYPEIIKPIYQTENQFSKCKYFIWKYIYPTLTCKYLALCEGDDYWTDENKLQKQFDVLEKEPDVQMCFHETYLKNEIGESYCSEDGFNYTERIYKIKKYYDEEDFINSFHFIATCSVVFRTSALPEFPDFSNEILSIDIAFLLLLLKNGGKFKMIPDVMSVYRKNPGGICRMQGEYSVYLQYIDLYTQLDKIFGYKKKSYFDKLIQNQKLQIMKKLSPELKEELYENSRLKKKIEKLRKRGNIFIVISIILFIISVFAISWSLLIH